MVLLHPPTSRPGYTGGTKAIGDRQALEMGRDDQGHSGTVKEEEEQMGRRAPWRHFFLPPRLEHSTTSPAEVERDFGS